ncbi:MAG TPA: adenylate/guanylate cyclase domain-containing protein [Roseomonas sp.]|nr:adenylate/guanylate cyclase domain-containing protein [Roseomonas sp.]
MVQEEASGTALRRERRLAAVAFLDLVAYSRLIEADEEGTLDRWAELRLQVIEPRVAERKGRIVERLGDGLLLEFQSAVEATGWALGLQAALRERSVAQARGPEAPTNAPLAVRIAIHVGDVVTEGDHIHGEGVNIAARLQEFAEPGGVVLSAAVHEQVGNVLRYDAVDLGPLPLKNIGRLIRAFSVPPIGPDGPHRAAALPSHRPSIAVLPLRSIGPDPVEPYFAEGLAHDVVGSLAAFRELFVVSSNSTLGLASEAAEAAAQALVVRYVVTGTVSRRGERLRIAVELSDTETRSVVWTDRYDTPASDLFAAQDAAATRIAYSLLPQLRRSELDHARRKPPSSQDAYDLVLQAMHHLYRLDEAERAAARPLLLRAVQRDPDSAMAHALLAHWHLLQVGESNSTDVESDRREAARHATRAVELDPSDPLGLAMYGHAVGFLFGQLDSAVEAFDRALASSPNSPIGWGMSSPTYAYLGDGPTAIARAEYALRLSPLDPYAHVFQGFLGLAHFVNGTHEESVRWSRRALAANPRFVGVLRHLTGSLVALGRQDEARETAARLLAVVPDFRVRRFLARYPIQDNARVEAYAALLLQAGLPE